MKRLLIILVLAFFSLAPAASAQVDPTNSNSLQNQSGAVQGNTSGLQNGSSLQQDSASLDSFNQSSSNIPITSSATRTETTPQPQATDTKTSWVSTLLLICLVSGAIIVVMVVWGILDSRKHVKVAVESSLPSETQQKPKKKKSKSSVSRRKRKKAHR